MEARILGAHDKSIQLESVLFEEVRKQVADQLVRVQSTASALAQLDVLNSFARISRQQNYVCPEVNLGGKDCAERKPPPCCGSVIGRRSVCSKRCTVR